MPFVSMRCDRSPSSMRPRVGICHAVAMEQAAALRRLLERPEMLVAPGAYDALGAMLVEQAGFAACYMTGAGTSVSRGYPDFGLLTMSEMIDNAARLAESIGIPLIADADTGY